MSQPTYIVGLDLALRRLHPVTLAASPGVAPPVEDTLPEWDSSPVASVRLVAANESTTWTANQFEGLLHPVGARRNWGYGGVGAVGRASFASPQFSDPAIIRQVWRSEAESRDAVVEGLAWTGTMMTRVQRIGNGASGATGRYRAWALGHDGFQNSQSGSGPRLSLLEFDLIDSRIENVTTLNFFDGQVTRPTGYSGTALAQTRFRLSTVGFEIKVEATVNNGATWQVCYQQESGWQHMGAGFTLWQMSGGSVNEGFDRIHADFLSDKPLWSDLGRPLMRSGESYLTDVYDVRDFGVKILEGTGSIAGGSSVLVMSTADHGFEVGHSIAIATGGEAGGGLRGTRGGVGGAFPTASVANVAALPAFGTPGEVPTFSRVHVQADGLVYVTFNDSRDWSPMEDYYDRLSMPRALRAKVVAVNGANVTLDTPAVNTATAARVVYDNRQTSFAAVVPASAGKTYRFPKGRAYFGAPLPGISGANCEITGEGRWATELSGIDGCSAFGLNLSQVNNGHIHDLAVIGTYRLDSGFLGSSGQRGIRISISDNTTIEDCRFVDTPNAVVVEYALNSTIRRCDAYKEATASYVQWEFQFADGGNNLIEDVKMIGLFITNGPEAFRSHGTVIRRAGGVNMLTANNSTDAAPYRHIHSVIRAGSLHGYDTNFHFNPIHNFNDNLGSLPGGQGDVVADDIVTVYEGDIRAAGRAYTSGVGQTLGLNVNVGPPNKWTGVIENSLLWVAPSMRSLDAVTSGFIFEAGGLVQRGTIRNTRSYSLRSGNHPGGTIAIGHGGPNVIENCQGSLQAASGGTITGAQTIEQWYASLGSTPAPTCDFRVAGNPDGTFDFWAYNVSEDGTTMLPLSTSSWGKIISYEWEVLDASDQVVRTDSTWWGTSGLLPTGEYTVRLTVKDELEQETTTTKSFTVV